MDNIMDGRHRSRCLLLAIGAIACCRAFLLSTPGPTARYGSLDRCLFTASSVRAQSYTQVRAADSMTNEEDVPIVFESLMAGDMAGVEEYVRSGGDCNVRDSIGDTPLMLAVESELTAVVSVLAKEGGADANAASEATGETPLQLASYYGYTHLVRMLVNECGASVDMRNKKGETALSLACFWGNTDTVEFLLEAGADPNNRNDAGDLPGEKFDSVFVPKAGDDGFGEGIAAEEQQLGPREAIMALLEKARAARREANSTLSSHHPDTH